MYCSNSSAPKINLFYYLIANWVLNILIVWDGLSISPLVSLKPGMNHVRFDELGWAGMGCLLALLEHLQQSPNSPFPITGIGRCPNSSFRIIGRVAFAVSQ